MSDYDSDPIPAGEEAEEIRQRITEVTRNNLWATRLEVALIALMTVGVLALTAFTVWTGFRIRELAQIQKDFADAHGVASYERTVVILHVLQCEAIWFVAYTEGKHPTAAELQKCFDEPVPPASVRPLPREPRRETD